MKNGLVDLDLTQPIGRSDLNRGLISRWLAMPVSGGGPYWYDLTGAVRGTLTGLPNGYVGGTLRPGGVAEVQFNGTGYVTCAQGTKYDQPSGGSLSVGMWYLDSGTGVGFPFSMRGSGSTGNGIEFIVGSGGSGLVSLRASNSSASVTVGPSANLNDGKWHYLLATIDGSKGEARFYVDGVATGTAAALTPAAITLAYSTTIGSRGGLNPFLGRLDDVSVWGRSFSTGDVRAYIDQAQQEYPEVLNRTTATKTILLANTGIASFSVAPSVVPSHHSGNITLTLTGTNTGWSGSSVFSVSGVTGVTKVSQSVASATSASLVITTGSSIGTLTITESVTGSATATISVGAPSLAISPTTGTVGSTPTLTLTGTSTVYSQETAAGLFTVAGGTGASIATPTVSSDTSASAVLTTGSATGTLTITDTSTGSTATFTVANPGPTGIAITSPVAYQFKWRGQSGTATHTVSGTYTGTASGAIEVSTDGGTTWATLVASPTGGTYSGSVSLATGTYTISVRWATNHALSASVANVSTAYVLAISGQSNSTGRATNNQTLYLPGGVIASLKTASSYAALADPYAVSIDSISTGSFVIPMVTALAQALNAPIGVIPCGFGGTSITQWQPGGTYYPAMISRINAVGGCDVIAWWQGEADAIAVMSQATYHADLAAMIAGVQSEIGCPVMTCTLEQCTTGTVPQQGQDNVNAAIIAGWNDIPGCLQGPDLRPFPASPESPYHLMTDEKITQAGAAWAAKVYSGVFATGDNGVTLDEMKAELDTRGLTSAFTTTVITNADVPTSTRSVFAGGTVAGVASPVTLTTAYDAAKTAAQAGDAMTVSMAQAVPTTNTPNTLGDCLNAARADGFGKWAKNGSTLTLFAPDGTTAVRTFTLDDPDAPSTRE